MMRIIFFPFDITNLLILLGAIIIGG